MAEKHQLLDLIKWHLEHHPGMAITDVYKLVYQGVMGAEHLLQDEARARRYLAEEWAVVPTDQTQPLLEPVSADGRIVRINIARAKADGILQNHVWLAFVRSAHAITPDTQAFERAWSLVVTGCAENRLPFEEREALDFGERARLHGYPAKHHSETYRERNRPAYRVARKNEFEQLWRQT